MLLYAAVKPLAIFLIAIAASACRAADPRPPIVLEGAMQVEVSALAAAIQDAREERIAGWTFWKGTVAGYPVIVFKTLKGMENAAAATLLAIERFHPAAIINQGTAGGHEAGLHVYDIVLGVDAINLGSFKTGVRARGASSDFAEWVPLDLLRSDGSAGQDPNARTMRRFHADGRLLDAARLARDRYGKGRVVDGVIGSSEIWNSELDRIQRFHDAFGTSAEDMETAAAAQIAGQFDVPFLGIRVLSNNITNEEGYNGKTAEACQEYVLEVVKRYASNQAARR